MVVGSIQIFSVGPQDFYLSGNPQITFFKSVFKRHTRFATRTERLYFDGSDPKFGSKNFNITVKKNGDLIGDIYIRADITATCDEAGVYTVNHFGNSLVKKVEVLIGKNVIDTHRSPWFQIHDEINTKNYQNKCESISSSKGGKNTNFNFLADVNQNTFSSKQRFNGDMPLVFGGGSRNNALTNGVGTYTKRVYIPLKFWFNKNPGMYLPLVALYNHTVDLNFDIETLDNLIGNNTNISNVSLDFQAYANYIILDENEKRRFAQSNHEYIIEQLQMNDGETGVITTTDTETTGNEIAETTFDLNFHHPVKYITWVIVNKGTTGQNSGQGPCYFTSLTNNSIYGNDGIYGTVDLYIGGVERELGLKMTEFTRYQHFKYCNNIPELDRIGFYSFAVNPLSFEPSGTCNFSRIKDNFFRIKFSNNDLDTIKGKTLYFFGVNYNILLITNGMGMIRYSS
jgi:hypothetical protein